MNHNIIDLQKDHIFTATKKTATELASIQVDVDIQKKSFHILRGQDQIQHIDWTYQGKSRKQIIGINIVLKHSDANVLYNPETRNTDDCTKVFVNNVNGQEPLRVDMSFLRKKRDYAENDQELWTVKSAYRAFYGQDHLFIPSMDSVLLHDMQPEDKPSLFLQSFKKGHHKGVAISPKTRHYYGFSHEVHAQPHDPLNPVHHIANECKGLTFIGSETRDKISYKDTFFVSAAGFGGDDVIDIQGAIEVQAFGGNGNDTILLNKVKYVDVDGDDGDDKIHYIGYGPLYRDIRLSGDADNDEIIVNFMKYDFDTLSSSTSYQNMIIGDGDGDDYVSLSVIANPNKSKAYNIDNLPFQSISFIGRGHNVFESRHNIRDQLTLLRKDNPDGVNFISSGDQNDSCVVLAGNYYFDAGNGDDTLDAKTSTPASLVSMAYMGKGNDTVNINSYTNAIIDMGDGDNSLFWEAVEKPASSDHAGKVTVILSDAQNSIEARQPLQMIKKPCIMHYAFFAPKSETPSAFTESYQFIDYFDTDHDLWVFQVDDQKDIQQLRQDINRSFAKQERLDDGLICGGYRAPGLSMKHEIHMFATPIMGKCYIFSNADSYQKKQSKTMTENGVETTATTSTEIPAPFNTAMHPKSKRMDQKRMNIRYIYTHHMRLDQPIPKPKTMPNHLYKKAMNAVRADAFKHHHLSYDFLKENSKPLFGK
jgi:hypothetical protein